MPFANVERVPGGYVVSRFFAVQAAAQRGVDLLMSVNEAAFDPARPPPAYDAHPGSLNLPSDADGEVAKVGVCHLRSDFELHRILRLHAFSTERGWHCTAADCVRCNEEFSLLGVARPLNLPSDKDGS